jgi:hypothetical protein
MGCGREGGGHAKAHHEATNHGIAICFENKHCHCYIDDEYCTEDNNQDEVKLIRETLEDVQSQTYRASTTRSGTTIQDKTAHWSEMNTDSGSKRTGPRKRIRRQNSNENIRLPFMTDKLQNDWLHTDSLDTFSKKCELRHMMRIFNQWKVISDNRSALPRTHAFLVSCHAWLRLGLSTVLPSLTPLLCSSTTD